VLERTATTRLALVHGDVSPKNILVERDDGHPVLLDAECAWYGDPAFDAAFCLNHLLLKAVHLPVLSEKLLAAAGLFYQTWLGHLPEEGQAAGERVAALLPCLMLARIDGKSPVEYLDEDARALVRTIARPLIQTPPKTVAAVIEATRLALARQH
jgi:thiamine kinase-like enzyme